MMDTRTKKGLVAISPLIVFLAFFAFCAWLGKGFDAVPLIVAFLVATVVAVATTSGLSLSERVHVFGRSAGTNNILFIILIFICAGAFASSAKAMGCIDATVYAVLSLLPERYIFVSIFLTGCIISMATGSGIGSIVALGPIAVGISHAIGGNMEMLCAIVVCGAMFGDNLSFISDTTVIATSTQGCELRDKFKANLWIALPASICTIILLIWLGRDLPEVSVPSDAQWIRVLPYILIIALSVLGVDVLVLLLCGALLCGIMGMLLGDFNFIGWIQAINTGIESMGPLTIMVILAAGLMGLVTHNGGTEFIIRICTRFVHSRLSAEVCIAVLTGLICLCTANNTIAIMTVSTIVKELSTKFGIDPRKAAALMDTSSCIVQELIPYSMHLLAAAAFAGISAASLIPHVYYCYLLLLFMIVAIIFNLPRFKKAA